MKCHLHLRNPFCYSDLDEDSDSDFDTLLTNRKRSPLVRRRGSLDSSPRTRMESASSTLTDLTESSSSPRLAISNGASMYALLVTSSLSLSSFYSRFCFLFEQFCSGEKAVSAKQCAPCEAEKSFIIRITTQVHGRIQDFWKLKEVHMYKGVGVRFFLILSHFS